MVINIIIYVTSDLRHAPFLYDGLKKLQSMGHVNTLILKPHKYYNRDRVVIKNNITNRINRPYPYSIVMDIVINNSKIKIGFDLQDWDYMFSHYSLKNCKIIYKRAYNQNMVDIIKNKYNNIDLLPFGFTFNTNFYDANFSRNALTSRLINGIFYSFSDPKYFFRYINKKYQSIFKIKNSSNNNFIPQNIIPKYDYIFFQVEYHNYKNHNEANMLNKYRSELIRELKVEFGKQFIGGMWSHSQIDNQYSDCHSYYLDKKSYLLLIKNASIVISTNGFGNSLPWKLAEYLKLGKCIVSEKLIHMLPKRLENNFHLMMFNNNKECIKICRELLINKEKSKILSENAKKYFDENVDTKLAVKKCIDKSLLNK